MNTFVYSTSFAHRRNVEGQLGHGTHSQDVAVTPAAVEAFASSQVICFVDVVRVDTFNQSLAIVTCWHASADELPMLEHATSDARRTIVFSHSHRFTL